MREERAGEAGGVMHCFTETWEVAQRALDLGFHISFSGIVTFKNAVELKDVARRVPLDRMLIETDSPYLAPVPHRGKRNQPACVRHVAEEIARLREVPVETIAAATSDNFFRPLRNRIAMRIERMLAPAARRRAASLALSFTALGQARLLDDLFIAVANDRAEDVKTLLARGMDPNSVDANGRHALCIAARNGSARTVDGAARREGQSESSRIASATRRSCSLRSTAISTRVRALAAGGAAINHAAAGRR